MAAAQAADPQSDLPKQATVVFDNPAFREYVDNVRKRHEQIIDPNNPDAVLYAGPRERAGEQAAAVVQRFRDFLAANRDRLTALRIYYSQPFRRRELTFRMVQEVVEALAAPPFNLTVVRVWEAVEKLSVVSSQLLGDAPNNQQLTTNNPPKKPGTPQRQLTDLVALLRYELKIDDSLRPYADTVRKNFQEWAFRKQAGGAVKFSEAQMAWLRQLRDFIAESVHLERDDLELGTLGQQGGMAKMYQLFGEDMDGIIEELNEQLAA